MKDFQNAIAQIIEHLPDSTINKLKEKILSGEIYRGINVNRFMAAISPETIHPMFVINFLNSWPTEENYNEKTIASIIEVAQEVKNKMKVKVPVMELAWTGPYPPSAGRARPTFNVIREMIASSRRNILIAGYAFSSGVESVQLLVNLIASSVQRGCEVTIALNNDGNNYEGFISIWPKYVPLPKLLHWTGRIDDPKASLHSKLVIVDSKDLLITSANLTFHGLESNIETGVRVTNHPIARQMEEFFYELERVKILVPY